MKKYSTRFLKRNHLTAKYILLCVSLFLLHQTSFSQELFKGKITGSAGQHLEGATVSVKGTQTAVNTSADGQFSIIAKLGETLEISFVGFVNNKVKLSENTFLNISLAPTVINMDEVMVTGYTSQRIKEITGSISSVKPKDLTVIPAGNIEPMLQGRAAGLTVITSGEPGAPANVRIRGIGNFGDATPLYIIDGVQGNINNLNPDDIESLQVLKDAASYSIYGVRGANGVIVVSTRKGKAGNMRINFDMYVGWQQPLKGLDVLNPQENANLLWLAKRNTGDTLSNGNPGNHLFGNGPTPVLPDYLFAGNNQDTLFEGSPYVADSLYNLNPDYPPIYQIVRFNKKGTDWFHELYKPAFSQNYSISLSGGSEKNHYLVSLGYLDLHGTMLNTYLKRFTTRVNTDFNYKNNIHFGENIQLSFTQNPKSNPDPGGDAEPDIAAPIGTSPAQPVYDTHGAWNPLLNYPRSGPFNNAVARRVMAKDNKADTWDATGNVYAALDFLNSFTLRSSFGGSLTNYYKYAFTPASYDNVTQLSSFSETSGYLSTYTWTNSLNYSRNIAAHSIKIMAASEIVNNSNREIGGSVKNLAFTDPNYWLLNNGDPLTQKNYSIAGISKLFSLFGRLDYGFKDKYFLSVTVRRDGSSVFGPQNRYGIFPAIGAAWRITEEKFLKNSTWLNDLKLRASWGKTGFNGNTDPFNQYTLYGGSNGDAYYDINGISSGSIQRGFRRVRIGNARTGWQEDVVTNIGMDAVLWNGKLSVNADWYIKETRGLLFKLALPDLLGDAIPPNVNTGNIRNTGIDLTLGSKGSFSKNWRWDALITFSHYVNKIIKLNDAPYFDDFSGIIRNEVGYPIGSFYGYKLIGLFQDSADIAKSPVQAGASPGRFKYADTNGRDSLGKLTGVPDGYINNDDRIHYGSPHPDFTIGFNIGVYFKNFDFSTFLYGSFGNDVLNLIRSQQEVGPFINGLGPASKKALYDSWTPERKNTLVPKAENSYNQISAGGGNSYSMENGSYLRNKSLMLGYTFSRSSLDKIKVNRLRVYVQVVNLFTITKYQGLDPELGYNDAPATKTNSVFGIDSGNYPNNQKKFLIGLTLGL